MKILYINAVCGVGSTGRIVTDLMQQAKSKGHTVKVACSTVEPIKGVDPDETIIVGSKLDYYIHNALSRLTDHEGLYSKAVTLKMLDRVRKFDPDIIHLHNLHGHWINYELLFQYLAESNKKVIWTLHDCWAFTGHCAHFSSINCEQWASRCSNCAGLRGYPVCYGKGDVSKNFDRKKKAFTSVKNMTIVTPSEWLAEMVRSSFLKEYNVIAVPNGIDLEIFKPTKSDFKERAGISDKKMILGVANVWSKRKGLDDILKLSKELGEEYSLVLVGLTREQMDALPRDVIGFQRTANIQELVRIYSAADVFVNPSYEETMGLVTAEAMACDTPVVVYDRTAVPEVVDEKSGIVVRAGDIKSLADAVKEIVSNTQAYTGMTTRIRLYEKEKQYNKYMCLYY